MKIACGKYEITILKIQPVTKHITYFCGVIQFKYSSKKQVSKTGQQNRILGFHVTSQDFPNMDVRHICAPQSVKFTINSKPALCSFRVLWSVL